MHRLGLLAVAACAGTAAPAPLTNAGSGASLPAWHTACDGIVERTPPPANGRRRIYEFRPLPLDPVRSGPTLAQRSRAGLARSHVQVEDLLGVGRWSLAGCWKWASVRGAKPATVQLTFEVDPFGHARAPSVRGDADRELIACIAETFRPDTTLVSARRTRMHARVKFELAAGQPPWPSPPARPAPAGEPRPLRTCGPVLDGVPADDVTAATTFVVDDADVSRTLPNTVPQVSLRCRPVEPIDVNKTEVRLAFASNRGAYERCYADALERTPRLTGTTKVVAELAASGVTDVDVTGAGDDEMHRCFAAATRALWFRDVWNPVEVNVPFELQPARRPLPASATPEQLEEAREWSRALAAWQRRAGEAPDALAQCTARAGAVRTLGEVAPWLDDARAVAAAHELAVTAGTLAVTDRAAAVACISTVRPQLLAIAGVRHGPSWSALDRIAALVPAFDVLDGADRLRQFHVEQLIADDRFAEARTVLVAMQREPKLAAYATEHLSEILGERPLELSCTRTP